jgi:hypothetical protein
MLPGQRSEQSPSCWGVLASLILEPQSGVGQRFRMSWGVRVEGLRHSLPNSRPKKAAPLHVAAHFSTVMSLLCVVPPDSVRVDPSSL